MIDLSFIPYGLQEDIIDLYEEAKPHDNEDEISARKGLFDYFVKKKLRRLMENIQEF